MHHIIHFGSLSAMMPWLIEGIRSLRATCRLYWVGIRHIWAVDRHGQLFVSQKSTPKRFDHKGNGQYG